MYPNLFKGLGELEGEFSIKLSPGSTPHAITTPRRVALPLMLKVKEELQRMEKLGVISKVDIPTDWCAGMVVVPKPDGRIRICVDLRKLNESVLRETYPLPKIETKPIRDLLSTKNEFLWGPTQQDAFEKLKKELTSTPVLAHYDPAKETILSADASSYGLGTVLLQEQENGARKPVAYASRSMSSTEQRYAQIEKEALATTWACEKFNDYIL